MKETKDTGYGRTAVGTTYYTLLECVRADHKDPNCIKYSALGVNENTGMVCSLSWNKWPPRVIHGAR